MLFNVKESADGTRMLCQRERCSFEIGCLLDDNIMVVLYNIRKCRLEHVSTVTAEHGSDAVIINRLYELNNFGDSFNSFNHQPNFDLSAIVATFDSDVDDDFLNSRLVRYQEDINIDNDDGVVPIAFGLSDEITPLDSNNSVESEAIVPTADESSSEILPFDFEMDQVIDEFLQDQRFSEDSILAEISFTDLNELSLYDFI